MCCRWRGGRLDGVSIGLRFAAAIDVDGLRTRLYRRVGGQGGGGRAGAADDLLGVPSVALPVENRDAPAQFGHPRSRAPKIQ